MLWDVQFSCANRYSSSTPFLSANVTELCDIPEGVTFYHILGLQIVGFVSVSEHGLSQSKEVKFEKQWRFNLLKPTGYVMYQKV